MATWYVDPGATGAGNGTSWADAYTALQTAVAAKAASLSEPCTFLCRSSNGAADTAAVTLTSYVTSAANYIEIKADTTDRATAAWDTSKYRLSVSGSPLSINEDYVRIDGLQIEQPTLAASANLVNITGIAAANAIWISNCHLRAYAHATYYGAGLSINDADANVSVWNTVIACGSQVNSSGNAAVMVNAAATVNVYSCTLVGHKYGLRFIGATGAVVAKNTYAGGTLTSDFSNASTGTLTNTNCASEDLTADDFGGSGNITGKAVDTDTFVDVTFDGGEDLSLAADGLSPLVGAGTDTSGESAPLNFTTDIVGTTRS